jgi:hypothetical protein
MPNRFAGVIATAKAESNASPAHAPMPIFCVTFADNAADKPINPAAIASTPSARIRPSDGTSTKPANSVPAMPPMVFHASTRPMSAPTVMPFASPSEAMRSANGNAAPSSIVGSSTSAPVATAKPAHIAASRLPLAPSTAFDACCCACVSHPPAQATPANASKPAAPTSMPKALHASRTRSATRAAIALPAASPNRYVASTTENAKLRVLTNCASACVQMTS